MSEYLQKAMPEIFGVDRFEIKLTAMPSASFSAQKRMWNTDPNAYQIAWGVPRTVGVRDIVLIFRHILPNSVGPIITRAMIAVPGAIFAESFLAYIGLGIKAPEPSIGVLLSDAQKTLLQYPDQTFFPAMLISLLMISFNLFSNGLRDALDPTKRGEE